MRYAPRNYRCRAPPSRTIQNGFTIYLQPQTVSTNASLSDHQVRDGRRRNNKVNIPKPNELQRLLPAHLNLHLFTTQLIHLITHRFRGCSLRAIVLRIDGGDGHGIARVRANLQRLFLNELQHVKKAITTRWSQALLQP